MKKKNILNLIISVIVLNFSILLTVNAQQNENSSAEKTSQNKNKNIAPDSFETYATKFTVDMLKRIPKKSTFAIKLVTTSDYTPDESLRLQVETTMSAILQKSSNFEAEIVPRSIIKTVWSEKQVFDGVSSSDIDKFFSKLSADYLIAIQFRPVDEEIISTIQVFSLQGNDSGKLSFSSVALPISINSNISSTSVKNKEETIKTLKTISEQINSLSSTGGLIKNPKTYSEHYHNARMLSQKGEIDLALKSYEEVLKNKIQFADAIIGAVDLLKRMYGNQSAKLYIEKNYKNNIPDLSYKFALQYLQDEPLHEIWLLQKNVRDEFPILSLIYLSKCASDRTQFSVRDINTTKNCFISFMRNVENDEELREIKIKNGNGIYLNYFIDTNKGIQLTSNINFQIENYFTLLQNYTKFPFNLKRNNTVIDSGNNNSQPIKNNLNDIQPKTEVQIKSETKITKESERNQINDKFDRDAYFKTDPKELQKNATKQLESLQNKFKSLDSTLNENKSRNLELEKIKKSIQQNKKEGTWIDNKVIELEDLDKLRKRSEDAID